MNPRPHFREYSKPECFGNLNLNGFYPPPPTLLFPKPLSPSPLIKPLSNINSNHEPMAVNSRLSTELLLPKDNWDEKLEIKIPHKAANSLHSQSYRELIRDGDDFPLDEQVIPVIYYLSRNGKLEHPHLIQVPVSSSHGLYLRDVINRLNFLRGNSMAFKYSWSSKRKYKSNGYVWQDLSEDDLIYPTNDHDYVLKGSEIPQYTLSFRVQRGTSPPNGETHCDNSSIVSRTGRRKNQSMCNLENWENHYQEEHRVYRCQSTRELGEQFADAATQTEHGGRRSRWKLREEYGNNSVELSREELSPTPEGVDGLSAAVDFGQLNQAAKNECRTRRTKASERLIQLISCGSADSIKCYSSIQNVKQEEFLGRVQFEEVVHDKLRH